MLVVSIGSIWKYMNNIICNNRTIKLYLYRRHLFLLYSIIVKIKKNDSFRVQWTGLGSRKIHLLTLENTIFIKEKVIQILLKTKELLTKFSKEYVYNMFILTCEYAIPTKNTTASILQVCLLSKLILKIFQSRQLYWRKRRTVGEWILSDDQGSSTLLTEVRYDNIKLDMTSCWKWKVLLKDATLKKWVK